MKEELKPDVSEKQDSIPEVQERPNMTIVSNDDAYIMDRISSQPKTLAEVIAVKEKTYGPSEHRLSLPKEFQEYTKDYRFRWINKKKRSIDDAINLKGWIVVNRTLFPHLPKHLFASSGAVENGDALLMFMSERKAVNIKKGVEARSAALRKSTPMLDPVAHESPKDQSGFYKPKDTSSEKDGVDGNAQQGYQEDRDF